VRVSHINVTTNGHKRYALLKLTGVHHSLRQIVYAAGIYPMSEGTSMLDGDLILHLQYPWQCVLLEAFMEFDPKQLPAKISAAQRVLARRLCDVSPLDMHERIALQDAMRSLHVLRPQPVGSVGSTT